MAQMNFITGAAKGKVGNLQFQSRGSQCVMRERQPRGMTNDQAELVNKPILTELSRQYHEWARFVLSKYVTDYEKPQAVWNYYTDCNKSFWSAPQSDNIGCFVNKNEYPLLPSFNVTQGADDRHLTVTFDSEPTHFYADAKFMFLVWEIEKGIASSVEIFADYSTQSFEIECGAIAPDTHKIMVFAVGTVLVPTRVLSGGVYGTIDVQPVPTLPPAFDFDAQVRVIPCRYLPQIKYVAFKDNGIVAKWAGKNIRVSAKFVEGWSCFYENQEIDDLLGKRLGGYDNTGYAIDWDSQEMWLTVWDRNSGEQLSEATLWKAERGMPSTEVIENDEYEEFETRYDIEFDWDGGSSRGVKLNSLRGWVEQTEIRIATGFQAPPSYPENKYTRLLITPRMSITNRYFAANQFVFDQEFEEDAAYYYVFRSSDGKRMTPLMPVAYKNY